MPQRPAAHTHAAQPATGHRGVTTLPKPLPFGTWPGGSEPVLQALGLPAIDALHAALPFLGGLALFRRKHKD